MDQSKETEYCENCNRKIPSVNFIMHISHCSRNLEICRECGEPVHVTLKDRHFKENHEIVKCEFCEEEVVISKLDDHKESYCMGKLVECTTCGIEVKYKDLDNHELYCQSRTELCDQCNKYVMIKDFRSHKCRKKDSNSIKRTATFPCEFCGQQIQFTELEEHLTQCHEAEDAQTNSEFPDAGFDEESDGTGMNERKSTQTKNACDLPCEFCNELFPSNMLEDHQGNCSMNDDSDIGPVNQRLVMPRGFFMYDPFETMTRNMLFDAMFNLALADTQGHFDRSRRTSTLHRIRFI